MIIHPFYNPRKYVAAAVGQRQVDSQGEWVVTGLHHENGNALVSRVRVGSLAHWVLAENEPRLLPVETVIDAEEL